MPNDIDSSSYSILLSMRNHNASLSIDDDTTVNNNAQRNFLNNAANSGSIPTFQNRCTNGHDLRADVHSEMGSNEDAAAR